MPKRKNDVRLSKKSATAEIKMLQEEIIKLKRKLEDVDWANRKTNEGIKILYKELEKKNKELDEQGRGLKKTNECIKLLYKELEEKNKELRRLDQLKSDFVSTVSHELRTPLSITKEGISLVLDEVPGKLGERQKDILRMSKDNIDRLADIINDLLDISKIEAGKVKLKKVLVDICDIVKDVFSRWKLESDKKNQDLRVSIPNTQINIYLDADKIIQVLNNLISNAIKYTSENGEIRIELKDKEDTIEISVVDSGIGISKEDLSKVFGKFQQFARTAGSGAKGTGLGLAIVKQLVEMHDGNIKVESKLNKGTKFTLFLPKKEKKEVFKDYINSGIREAIDENVTLSLLFFGISEFSQFEKELGCYRMDNFLKEIERLIKDCLRCQTDIVVRGMGELAVLLLDTRKENVKVVRKRIDREIINYLSKCKEKQLKKIRIYFGFATYPDDAATNEELLEKARAIIFMRGSNRDD